MKFRFKEFLSVEPKSKIKAGAGLATGEFKFFTSSQAQSKYLDSWQYETEALIFGTGGNASVHYVNEKFSTSTDCFVMTNKLTVLINLKCVFYFLIGNIHILAAGFKGCGLQHISKDYILNLEITLPEKAMQDKIVRTFDLLFNVQEAKEKQLINCDRLVKSQFIEMFGELGKDENGWGLSSLGDCCEVNPKKGNDIRLVEGLEVSFVPMPAVTENGEIDSSNIRLYEQVRTGFTYFVEDDVLFAKITPCMENGKGAIARGLVNGVGFGSTEFHVLRPKKGHSISAWIYAVTSFDKFRQDAARKMTGSAGQRRVPSSFLQTYAVSLPPIELQNQFARFVEQTDKSKLAIKRSLEKLQVLQKALMQKYFG